MIRILDDVTRGLTVLLHDSGSYLEIYSDWFPKVQADLVWRFDEMAAYLKPGKCTVTVKRETGKPSVYRWEPMKVLLPGEIALPAPTSSEVVPPFPTGGIVPEFTMGTPFNRSEWMVPASTGARKVLDARIAEVDPNADDADYWADAWSVWD